MNLFCGECRARSDCTYVQFDLALHSSKFYKQIPSTTKSYPMPWNQFKSVCIICQQMKFGWVWVRDDRLIDCMVFNDAGFNIISVISRRPVHLSMISCSSFHQYSARYFLQATRPLLSQITNIETMDSAERGRNSVTMTINYHRKKILVELGIEPANFSSQVLCAFDFSYGGGGWC